MSLVNIQIDSVKESTTQAANAGQLFRIWNGELYPETIAAMEAEGVVVIPNLTAADPTKQYVFYNIQVMATC